MFGWGKYVADVVNNVAQEVTQFGQEAIESVVGDEEEGSVVEEEDPIRRQLRQLAENARTKNDGDGEAPSEEEANQPTKRESTEEQTEEVSPSGDMNPGVLRYTGMSSEGQASVPAAKVTGSGSIAKKGKKGKFAATKIESTAPAKNPVNEHQEREELKPEDDTDESSWVPNELRFASQQPRNLLNFGKTLVESGAGLALSVLPDVDETNESDGHTGDVPPSVIHNDGSQGMNLEKAGGRENEVQSSATPAVISSKLTAASTAPAEDSLQKPQPPPAPQTSQVDSLELLRQSRGRAELKRRRLTTGSKEGSPVFNAQKFVEEILDPVLFSSMECSEEILATSQWIGATSVGRQMRAACEHCTSLIDLETGARLHGVGLYEKMIEFPKMLENAAEGIAVSIVDELAETFAKGKPPADSDWFKHNMNSNSKEQRDAKEHSPSANPPMKRFNLTPEDEERIQQIVSDSNKSVDVKLLSKNVVVARNVASLLFFGLCEIQAAATTFRDEAHSCFVWAKKNRRDDSSLIKERVTKVRTECFSAGTKSVARIVEAVECVASLFPPVTLTPKGNATSKKPSTPVVASA